MISCGTNKCCCLQLLGAGDRDLEKQLDLEGASYSDEEPEFVKMARSELKVIEVFLV